MLSTPPNASMVYSRTALILIQNSFWYLRSGFLQFGSWYFLIFLKMLNHFSLCNFHCWSKDLYESGSCAVQKCRVLLNCSEQPKTTHQVLIFDLKVNFCCRILCLCLIFVPWFVLFQFLICNRCFYGNCNHYINFFTVEEAVVLLASEPKMSLHECNSVRKM